MNNNTFKALLLVLIMLPCFLFAQVLNKQSILDKHIWNNKDWAWYKNNIPFIETPDKDIDRTYYYRWDNLTLHLVYGSPVSGYACTEFIDRPWWSGKYGTISCAAGHQLYEMQWLRNTQYWEDFAQYWFKTPGAQPRNYSTWLADAVWNGYKVQYNKPLVLSLKNDLVSNYGKWEKERWVEAEGMFSWDGMHDGMETNINSRQTAKWFEGAPGYRPTLNSYMWADANAISSIAKLSGDVETVKTFNQKAATIKSNFQQKNWDPKRDFFFHRFTNDERDGIKANSLTYQTGKFAGNPHGREQIGFVPWYFNMPDAGFESAWKFLMDSNYFYSPFGPTTVEKMDPLYNVAKNCCAWSGNAWPFATSQTLKGMANLLRNYQQSHVTKNDYIKLLDNFANTHLKDGVPFIGEANHPETGSWSGHDYVGHSEHYFHSSYIDLVITGLMGLQPKDSDSIEVNPLIPTDWEYACVENVKYHGNDITIIWDKTGKKYKKGKGLIIYANGKKIATSSTLKKLVAPLKTIAPIDSPRLMNYAVNNEARNYYPHISTSFAGTGASYASKMNDGQYWYLSTTPNRWATVYNEENNHWAEVDFGTERSIETIKLYFVEDTKVGIQLPASYDLAYWNNGEWKTIPAQQKIYDSPQPNAANIISFPSINTSKIKVLLTTKNKTPIGISEIETWGMPVKDFSLPKNPLGANNLAHRSVATFTRSYQSRFDDSTAINNGLLDPNRRWTAFESKNTSDWVQFSFKETKTVSKVYLYVYNDNGGVKPPKSYKIEYWDGQEWKEVSLANKLPITPIADLNICSFSPIQTDKIRITLEHLNAKSFSGLYEVEIH
ncbi:MAG: hypothetical protein C0446_01270 [Chitinophaga sp.]|nr:hypothetical protein [Chitinophaga sp.]